MRSAPYWLGCFVAASLAACGSSSKEERRTSDVVEYELFSTTRALQPAELRSLAFAGDDGTLVFDPAPATLDDLAVGEVLLAGGSEAAPSGLLRIVAGVDRRGDVLTLRTMGAPLQLAFRKLHVRVAREAYLEDGSFELGAEAQGLVDRGDAALMEGKGEKKQRYDVVVFDGDGDLETTNDQVRIDATFSGGYGYRLALDLDWGALEDLPAAVVDCLGEILSLSFDCSLEDLLPEAKATFHADPFLALELGASGAAMLSYEKDLVVGTVRLPPVVLGFFVFTPSIEVLAKVEGGASASFQIGAHGKAEFESSVTLSSKDVGSVRYAPPELKDYSVEATPPEIDLHANAEARVGARLNVALYGMLGPYATASGVAAIHAAPLDDPCWSLRFALEMLLGVRLTTPDLPVIGYAELLHWQASPFRPLDEEVATGSCVVPPRPPPLPGSGPDTDAVQLPTFEPWAKVVGGEIDGTLAASVGTLAYGNPDLVRSVDGRLLVAGAFTKALHKISEDGALVWRSKLVTGLAEEMVVQRSVATRDAGILALLKPPDSAAFILAKLRQSGELVEARSYHLPDTCIAVAEHLMQDGGTGFLVLGRCLDDRKGWIVHLDAAGAVIWARQLEEVGFSAITPLAGHAVNGEWVVAGKATSQKGLDWTFVQRFDADGKLGPGTAWLCAERTGAEPRMVIPSENGGVTVVGDANGPGFVARIRKDGTLGFVHYPNRGVGVPDVFAVSSVVELPITGMVLAASMGDVTSSEPNAIALVGLDGAGSVLWGRRYSIEAPEPRAIAWPALRITDDGGVLVTAVAGPAGGRTGDLVAMKVFLKDGFLGDGAALQSEDLALQDHPCQVSRRAFVPILDDLEVRAAPLALRRQ